jgi:hypothetical protein
LAEVKRACSKCCDKADSDASRLSACVPALIGAPITIVPATAALSWAATVVIFCYIRGYVRRISGLPKVFDLTSVCGAYYIASIGIIHEGDYLRTRTSPRLTRKGTDDLVFESTRSV